MCERLRPNEAFSGRNHRRHLCRQCARRPRAEREREQKLRTLWQILHRQSNISEKNIRMSTIWANDLDPEVATLARLTVEIGRLHPRRRRRYGHIRRTDAALFQRMIAAGVVLEWPEEQDSWQAPGDPAEALEPFDPFGAALGDDDIPF